MTENTPTTAELRKLVAEARLRHDRIAGHFPGETVSPLSTRLADALEAVTAERDALAATHAEAPHEPHCDTHVIHFEKADGKGRCDCWKSKLPADALAARDAASVRGVWQVLVDSMTVRGIGMLRRIGVNDYIESHARRIEREAH